MMPGLKQFDEDDYYARGGEAGWRADRDLERELKDRRSEKQDTFEGRPTRRWFVTRGPYQNTVTARDADEAVDEFVRVNERNGVSVVDFDPKWDYETVCLPITGPIADQDQAA